MCFALRAHFLVASCLGLGHKHWRCGPAETKGVPIEEMRLLWRRHPVWRRILGKELDAGEPTPAVDGKGSGAANGFVKGSVHLDEPLEAHEHVGNGKVWKAAV